MRPVDQPQAREGCLTWLCVGQRRTSARCRPRTGWTAATPRSPPSSATTAAAASTPASTGYPGASSPCRKQVSQMERTRSFGPQEATRTWALGGPPMPQLSAGQGGASQLAPVVKNSPAHAGDTRDVGSIPGLGRSPGGGHGNPLQFACLESPMDRGAWWAAVQGVTKSRTRLITHALSFSSFQKGVQSQGLM